MFVIESAVMEAFFITLGTIALAELGDKSQLLAFILASRFKKPLPVIMGITMATIFNNSIAGALGAWLSNVISPITLHWIIILSFFLMALWMLVPEKEDEKGVNKTVIKSTFGIFIFTLFTFIASEMGDKTQLATLALAANFDAPITVVIAATIGMLVADLPAVWVGDRLSHKIQPKYVRWASAFIFIVIAIVLSFEKLGSS